MKFGFIMPQGTTNQILEIAQEIEAAGWDGFFYWDGIGIGHSDVFDPWAILAAVAVKTERVTLGAMIFPLSRRRPWKVAREAMTVDHLSQGRLVLPVGLGALDDGGFSRVHPETTDRKTRSELLDETLEILDLAWRGEPFSYAGKHYQMEEITFQPRPVQQPRIPIWVVAAWPRPKSMARAARWDGIIPSISAGHAGRGARDPRMADCPPGRRLSGRDRARRCLPGRRPQLGHVPSPATRRCRGHLVDRIALGSAERH